MDRLQFNTNWVLAPRPPRFCLEPQFETLSPAGNDEQMTIMRLRVAGHRSHYKGPDEDLQSSSIMGILCMALLFIQNVFTMPQIEPPRSLPSDTEHFD
jgi:hypothetical protein